MNTNMRSTWLCTKVFFPPMLERGDGAVIFVSFGCRTKRAAQRADLLRDQICADGIRPVHRLRGLAQKCKGQRDRSGRHQHELRLLQRTRTPGDPVLDGMQEPEGVAEAVLYALLQPPQTRVFLVGMRPMNEALSTGSGSYFTGSED